MNAARTPFASFLTLLAFGALLAPAPAEYIQADLVDVPVKRLLANLEEQAKAKPKDAVIQERLARVHAMAYVRNVTGDDSSLKVLKGGEDPWFGYEPRHVPFAPFNPLDRGKQGAVAKAHLEKAIFHYKKSLSIKPRPRNRLGLAWCLDHAGKSEPAIAGYRAIIDEIWIVEGKAKLGTMRGFVAAEAIVYLLPLLDEEKDAKEIADLNRKKKKLESLPRPITPIVIPLRKGVAVDEIIDSAARVPFDLDGTGRRQTCQWIDPAKAGWLVHDPRQTGSITSAIQMFGSRSFLMFFEHGYEALSLLDDDGDGSLRGEELAGLAIWHDRNADGSSDPGEVNPLQHYKVRSLSCAATRGPDGIYSSPKGLEFSDGSRRPTYDVVLKSTPSDPTSR